MKRPKSDIPEGVTEVEFSPYKETGHETGRLIYFRGVECILDGKVVGQRFYDLDGRLMKETPMKNGKKHGREYIWEMLSGHLESVEPYFDGKLHGLAKQYGHKGNVIGSYRFVHGNGYDIWRGERADGSTYISEIFTVRDNSLHGYEWWVNEDQRSVYHERHWQHGQVHGIERKWNQKNRLRRGCPKYWIQGKAVPRRVYLKASEKDPTLPKFREKDNQPRRKFPDEIEKLLKREG